jgi:TatD DNase family protein
MIDAHAHLDDPRFPDPFEVLERAHRAGVCHVVMAGTAPEGWAAQRALAQGRQDVTTVFGLHPWYVRSTAETKRAVQELEVLLAGPHRPGAIGETGLDRAPRHRDRLELQLESFRSHLELASRHELPVVLHVVAAHGLALEVLGEYELPAGGMVHGYSGSAELVAEYERMGLHVSVGGRVCSAEARKLHESVCRIHPERLLVETDAPDALPVGAPGTVNEPSHLGLIVDRVAALRGEDPARLATQTHQNASRLFRLDV